MKIIPTNNKLQIKIDQPTVGSLDLSSKPTAVEYGIVVGIGEGVSGFKIGDKIFFKAWALDVITYEKEAYYFLDALSDGICAYVK